MNFCNFVLAQMYIIESIFFKLDLCIFSDLHIFVAKETFINLALKEGAFYEIEIY